MNSDSVMVTHYRSLRAMAMCQVIRKHFVQSLLLICGLYLWASMAVAQSLPANITQEQIEQFKSLPRAQQEMIARQYGIDPAQFTAGQSVSTRSEEHTSELQSRENLVCRLLLEKNKHKDRR